MTTKIQTAIDYIAKRSSARTPDLAKVLGIAEANVSAYLRDAVKDGRLVSCKVEIPGRQMPMNEYRIGSGVPIQGEKPLRGPALRVNSKRPDADLKPPPSPAPTPAQEPAARATPDDELTFEQLTQSLRAMVPAAAGCAFIIKHNMASIVAFGHTFVAPPNPDRLKKVLDAIATLASTIQVKETQ